MDAHVSAGGFNGEMAVEEKVAQFGMAVSAAFRGFLSNGGEAEGFVDLVIIISDGCGSVGSAAIADFRPVEFGFSSH